LRIAVGVEYAGEHYAGWQGQPHAPSVQAEVERALGRVAAHPVAVVAAGRTDAGVHALGQVVHFDTTAERDARSWVLGANTHLPDDIALTFAVAVPQSFHARYSAESRAYRYLVLNRPTRPAVAARRVAWRHQALAVPAMQAAALQLLGEHDFSAFRAAECQAQSPVRRLLAFTIERRGELLEFEVRANAFLHHMVRNLVGTLLEVGSGAREVAWPREVLASRDRRIAGPTAEAAGLYFVGAAYPAQFGLPQVATADSAMMPRDGVAGLGPAAPARWPG
jgi:tRNA pseudouridine38-40 synthase